MKFIHLSDTHGKHHELPKLPAADLIIHSGDVSMAGTGKEVMDFIDWFGALNYKYKIFIAGNHDFCLDGKAPKRIQRFLPENMYYIYNSGVEIENIRFWAGQTHEKPLPFQSIKNVNHLNINLLLFVQFG